MAPILGKAVSDLDIQEWVRQNYGSVPHPYWISHCRHLYLQVVCEWPRKPWHECPPDKREAILRAFEHFGLMQNAGRKLAAGWK